MKRFAAFILAAGMLLCFGCADGDGPAKSSAAPTQLNRVENVKVLSFEKWSEQREAMGVDEAHTAPWPRLPQKARARC